MSLLPRLIVMEITSHIRLASALTSTGAGGMLTTLETEPWVALTLPTANYVMSGVLIKKRCTILEHFVKRVAISTSVDGVAWQDVIADEDLVYGSEILAGVWFSVGYTTRYWKIIAKTFAPPHASMKCDLIGKALI